MIVIDEIVCYNTPSVLLKDVGVKEGDTETEIAGKISMLEKIFTLVDVSSVEEELVTIYYDKITFEEGPNGATIVVFPPAAFETDSGIGLNSGSNYMFILNHVMDTTGNEMEKDTELEVFRTSPPLVILTQTNSPFDTKYKDMDYAFSVKPEAQKTSDRVLFDMIFETDTMIKFELYQWIKGKVNPDTGTSDSPTETGYWKQINHLENDSALDKNRGTTLHQILDLEVKDATDADYTGRLLFEQFNELKEEEYAVKIVQIGSDDLRGGWNAVVNMDVKCIAGQYDDMGAMVTIATQNTNPNYSSILKGGKVSMVNQSNQNIADPSEFIMKMTFSDTIIPKFLDGYPRLEKTGDDEKNIMIGDTFIAPQLMTDRFATMYYLIAPKGNILLDWETNDTGEKVKPKQESLDSYAYQIMNNSLKVTGSFWGAYNIESGAALYQPQFPTDGELMPGGEKYMKCSLC